jgi:hypothetical protein
MFWDVLRLGRFCLGTFCRCSVKVIDPCPPEVELNYEL